MKKMLDDYEKGYADSIQLGKGLELEERGTGYMKFGVDPKELEQDFGSCLPDSPPGSGTWIWGTVDGVCQWIDTTTCS